MKRKVTSLTPFTGFIPGYKESPKRPEPIKVTEDELKKLTLTIMGKEFFSFGTVIVCTKCGLAPQVLINRAPDEEFNFYLAMACTCQDPEPQPEPTPVEDPTPVEPTAS